MTSLGMLTNQLNSVLPLEFYFFLRKPSIKSCGQDNMRQEEQRSAQIMQHLVHSIHFNFPNRNYENTNPL